MVHFKDELLIRHEKRWSQQYIYSAHSLFWPVVYLYDILGWRLTRKYFKRLEEGEDETEPKERMKKEKDNTYLLALDGDTDFQPSVVMLLIDGLKRYPHVGAACGRIHPTGHSRIKVKTAGCALSCRSRAGGWSTTLRPTPTPTPPRTSRSSITSVGRPTTMANTIDLLGSGSLTSQRNSFISKPFILYQIITMAASILSPATICLMISGSLSLILHIDPKYALILATVPPVLYLVLCFKLKLDTQVTIAAIMSALYAFLMMGTALFIMGAMVEEQTIWNPSGLFIIGMVLTNTITAALHPKGVPSGHLRPPLLHLGYLLLTIYPMVNMNNVSWGTWETGGPSHFTTTNQGHHHTAHPTGQVLQKFLLGRLSETVLVVNPTHRSQIRSDPCNSAPCVVPLDQSDQVPETVVMAGKPNGEP
ncbi:unnamed protein product [Coregonus sp. 'balchen']|nr:unnamed protein product [Coregonus sp. 'balchen']